MGLQGRVVPEGKSGVASLERFPTVGAQARSASPSPLAGLSGAAHRERVPEQYPRVSSGMRRHPSPGGEETGWGRLHAYLWSVGGREGMEVAEDHRRGKISAKE